MSEISRAVYDERYRRGHRASVADVRFADAVVDRLERLVKEQLEGEPQELRDSDNDLDHELGSDAITTHEHVERHTKLEARAASVIEVSRRLGLEIDTKGWGA